MGAHRAALVLLALAHLWCVTQSATKVRLVDCAGGARLHRFDFGSHTSWEQALATMGTRFGLPPSHHERLEMWTTSVVETLEALMDARAMTATLRGCEGDMAPVNKLHLEGADKHGGRSALFQIPVSVMNSTTGKRMQQSVIVRTGDTAESAAVEFCEQHGVEDCTALYRVVEQRMLTEVQRVQPDTSDALATQLRDASASADESRASLLPGLGHKVPESWLPTDLPSEMEEPPAGLMRWFDRKKIPGLETAWDACAAIYRDAPAAPLKDMSAAWTAATAQHWEWTHNRPIDIPLYQVPALRDACIYRYQVEAAREQERETRDATMTTPVVNLMLRQGRAELCVKKGCTQLAEGTNWTDVLAAPPGLTDLPRLQSGMASSVADLRIAHGSGWTTRSSHLVFETERTMTSSTASDLTGTAAADKQVGILERAMEEALGDGFIELRGLFLYAPHGFREWHANMYDPEGWRMYLVHTEDAPGNRSWFSIRDPQSKRVYDLADRNGQINLFRVSRKEPVWHSIVSKDARRWSCGVRISDAAADWIFEQLDSKRH